MSSPPLFFPQPQAPMCGAGHDKSLPLRCVWQSATLAPCLVGTGCWRFAFGASPYRETLPASGSPQRTRPRAKGTTQPPPVLTTPSTLRFLARLGSTLAHLAHYRTSPHTPSAFSRGRENTRRERCSRGEKMGFARFFTHGSAITAHSARAKAVFSGREFSTSGALPRVSLRDTLNNPDPNHCNTALCVFESFTNGNLSAMLTENKMP